MLESLVAVSPGIDARLAGTDAGGELIVRAALRIAPSGDVVDIESLVLPFGVSELDGPLLEDAARRSLESARFAASGGAESGEATVDLVWRVGPVGRLGSGPARIEPNGAGSRAIVPAISRITQGMTPPVIVEKVEPMLPQAFLDAPVDQSVAVEVVIDMEGAVRDPRLLKGSEDFPELDAATLDAVSGWTYEPAQQDGMPIAVTLVISMKYRAPPD